MISLRIHNILDYVAGAVLMISPWVFGFSDVIIVRNTFLTLGIGVVLYSLLTKYYYSVAKLIPLRAHMFLDIASGILLMLSPTMFNYQRLITNGQHALHYILGFGVIGLVFLTDLSKGEVSAAEGSSTAEKPRRVSGL